MAVWITDAAGKRVCVARDGKDGVNGKNATINGMNTLTIEAGENVDIQQEGTKLIINATGGGATITEVPIPSQNGTQTYNGAVQTPSWNDYSPSAVELTGQTTGTDAGTYTVTATLKDPNSFWNDDTRTPKTLTWVIEKAVATMPAVSGTLTYNKQAQTPVLSGYVAEALTKSGDTSKTNAGDYSMGLTPTANYRWPDGTSATKQLPWNIAKAACSISLDKTSLSLTTATPTGEVNITCDGDGTLKVTSSAPTVAEASLSGKKVTVTGKETGSATITVEMTAGTNYNAPTSKTFAVNSTVVSNQIIGVCWNYSNSSPTLQRLTRANDPNKLVTLDITSEPVPAVGTGAGSSPFDNIYPWNKIDEWNVVSGVVTVKRGQSGFSRTANDVVVFIPEYYFKVVEDATNKKRYFYISQKAATGFTKHPGSGRCVGKYNTGAGYVSKSGLAPLVNITRAAVRDGHKGRGAKFNNYDFATWCAIQLLYLVEFASFDSQSKIGRGYVDGNSAAINTGGCDAMTYHTGRAAGTDGKTAVMYRWMENLWGNVFDWCDGANFNERAAYICTDPSKFADDTTTGYTAAGVTLPSSNYISGYGFSSALPWALIPNLAAGSETTFACDYVSSGTGGRVLAVGGLWGSTGYAGLFYFYASSASSYAVASRGARQLYVPTAAEIATMAA